MKPRRTRNSSKVNLIISFTFHALIVVALFVFAAREGLLGKKLKSIAVVMVPKEKPPEKPKEKPPEPKAEPPKEVAKANSPPQLAPPDPVKVATAPPPMVAPAAAPPSTALPSFDFSDGAKEVTTSSDPIVLYKGLVEYALRSRWNRPEGLADDAFVAEVEVSVDAEGKLKGYDWRKGSGDPRWDDSVKLALNQTRAISRKPPKNFPEKFLVRFDIEAAKTEPLIQASAR